MYLAFVFARVSFAPHLTPKRMVVMVVEHNPSDMQVTQICMHTRVSNHVYLRRARWRSLRH